MSEEVRIRRQVEMLGEDSLNALDKWRLKAFDEQAERKTHLVEQECAERQRAAAAASTDEIAELRAELAELRAAHNKNIGIINKNSAVIHRDLDASDARADRQDEAIRQLKAENAELKLKVAEQRVAELDVLHRNLVAATGATINAFNDAASRRAEQLEVERQPNAEVAVVEAKANALAAELERLKEAHKNFRFAREEPYDDGMYDLPAGFLPSRRQ